MFLVESGAGESFNAEDQAIEFKADDRLLQQHSLGGAGVVPQTPPGMLRPIPQSYMIRQPATNEIHTPGCPELLLCSYLRFKGEALIRHFGLMG